MPAPTFRDFVAVQWKAACYDRCKPSTRKRMDSALQTQLLPAFGVLPLDRIDRAAVHLWFDCYSRTTPGGANRTLDVLRQILNHAIACGYIAANPTRGVIRNPRRKLTRFLSRAEVDRLHQALDVHRGRGSGRQQAEIIRLLLLTGCRKGELVRLRWSEVDGDMLRLSDAKTGPRSVFLNAPAQAILARQPRTGSAYVFPSLVDSSRPRSMELSLWSKVCRQAGFEGVRLHDLARHVVFVAGTRGQTKRSCHRHRRLAILPDLACGTEETHRHHPDRAPVDAGRALVKTAHRVHETFSEQARERCDGSIGRIAVDLGTQSVVPGETAVHLPLRNQGEAAPVSEPDVQATDWTAPDARRGSP